MTNQYSATSHSATTNNPEESAHMNLDTLARLETRAREAEIRHHLNARSLEHAADRQRHRPTATRADGQRLVNRFIGWLAPRRVASATRRAMVDAQEPAVLTTAGDSSTACLDCQTATTRNRAA
jgi:hypothetical protein